MSRVVLGCDLEFLDGLVTLFLEFIESALGARDAIVEQASTDSPHSVDSARETLSVAARTGGHQSSYKTGPPAIAMYSLEPQLSHPSTSASIIE